MKQLNKTIIMLICAFLCGCSSYNADGGNPVNKAYASEKLPGLNRTVGNDALNQSIAKEEAFQSGDIISSYFTEYPQNGKARSTNITLAAEKINGTVVEPGEIFSFNEAVGPTNKAAGFKKARIFIKGKDSLGFGGGVCQVSSTLYNAALQAGMEIIERHPHSKKVEYVPKGQDAATSYGDELDFRFKNNKDYSVKISASAEEGKLTVSIAKK